MFQQSQGEAIYGGAIYLTDTTTKQRTTTEAILDDYHKYLKFDFEGKGLVFNFSLGNFVFDSDEVPKEISKFFLQKLSDDTIQVQYLSFLLTVGNCRDRIFYVEGYLVLGFAEHLLPDRHQ